MSLLNAWRGLLPNSAIPGETSVIPGEAVGSNDVALSGTGADIREPNRLPAPRSVLNAVLLLALLPTTTSAQQSTAPPPTTLDLTLRGEPGTSIHWDGVYLGDLDPTGQLRIGGVPRGLTIPLEASRDGFQTQRLELQFGDEPSPAEATIAPLEPLPSRREEVPLAATQPEAPASTAEASSRETTSAPVTPVVRPKDPPEQPGRGEAMAQRDPRGPTGSPAETTPEPRANAQVSDATRPTTAAETAPLPPAANSAATADSRANQATSPAAQPSGATTAPTRPEAQPEGFPLFATALIAASILISSAALLILILRTVRARSTSDGPADDAPMTPGIDIRPASAVTRMPRETPETALLREQLSQRENQLDSNQGNSRPSSGGTRSGRHPEARVLGPDEGETA